MNSNVKSYSKLVKLHTFKERYDYLRLSGDVCSETFGSDRYLNQQFYSSKEWISFRNKVIIRDNGCDLAMPDTVYQIKGKIYIHHLNPITKADIVNRSSLLFDLDNVVCVCFNTHQAIHYGSYELLTASEVLERRQGDTCLWR